MLDTALLAHDQFLAEVNAIPVYSGEELREFAVQAAADHAKRNAFVEAFLPKIVRIARARVHLCKHLDLLDVVQMGVEVLFERLHRALLHPDPVGYLYVTIDKQVLWLVLRFDSLITVPTHASVHSVASLDTPLTEDSMRTLVDVLEASGPLLSSPDRDYTALYQAIDQLPQDQQVLLARRYGLFGQAPTSCADLAREMFPGFPSEKVREVWHLERSALRALKRILVDTERQKTFYTACEIEQLYGVDSAHLTRFARKGLLTRYSAPDSCYGMGNKLTYVYDRSEVDKLLKDWKPCKRGCHRLKGVA